MSWSRLIKEGGKIDTKMKEKQTKMSSLLLGLRGRLGEQTFPLGVPTAWQRLFQMAIIRMTQDR